MVHPALLFVPQVGGHVEVLPAHAHELLDLFQTLDLLVVALLVAALHYLGVLAYHDDVMPQLQQGPVCGVFLDQLVHHLED